MHSHCPSASLLHHPRTRGQFSAIGKVQLKRISPTTIDAIFLDVGGTIVRPRGSIGSAYSECLASYGIDADAETLDQAFGVEFQRRKKAARRLGGTAYGSTREQAEAFWKDVFFSTVPEEFRSHGDLGMAFEEIYAFYGRAEAWELFDDTLPFLQAVQDLGIPLIIVSNCTIIVIDFICQCYEKYHLHRCQ